MVDELPDIDAIDDASSLRALLKQLIGTIRSLQSTTENLQATVTKQTETIERKDAENAELRRLLFGKKSERMPPLQREVKKRRKKKSAKYTAQVQQQAQKKRKRNAEVKKKLPTEEVEHRVRDDECQCPHCGGSQYDDLGEGEVSFEYEYIPSRLVRRKHVRQKKACRCGRHIVTGPAPDRVADGVQYGPGFHAHVAVSKCSDSMPLYRQEKQLNREGVPICRSTLCDIFHRTAELLSPLHRRILELVGSSPYVNADETPIPVMDDDKTKRAYIWTFNAEQLVGYAYSSGRSGETPLRVLGNSNGYLQVDAFSGYNRVTTPEGRTRVGCIAHLRRYFWKARETAPEEAQHVLDKILDLYEVEYQAADKEILGRGDHLALRKALSAPIMAELSKWLADQEPQHPPKSPLGQAITYARNNWESLTRFLEDPKLALDNNVSERQLRIVALGRKNFLFVGHDEAGENLAVLQSLVSTCELNGVNPEEYLADVLMRIQTHPQSRIDELLPHKWKPPDEPEQLPLQFH
jgi:transposase